MTGPRARRAVLVLACMTLAVLVVVARLSHGSVHRLDVSLDVHLNQYLRHHHDQVRSWRVITAVGGPLTWRVLGAVVALVLWCRRQRRAAALVAAALVGAAVLSGALKVLVGRSRPVVPHPLEHVGGGSFPSGHALTSGTALALLVVLAAPHLSPWPRRVLVIASAAVVLAVGASRVMLGVHYLTDVVGGWLVAALWLLTVQRLLRPGVRRVTATRRRPSPRRQ